MTLWSVEVHPLQDSVAPLVLVVPLVAAWSTSMMAGGGVMRSPLVIPVARAGLGRNLRAPSVTVVF